MFVKQKKIKYIILLIISFFVLPFFISACSKEVEKEYVTYEKEVAGFDELSIDLINSEVSFANSETNKVKIESQEDVSIEESNNQLIIRNDTNRKLIKVVVSYNLNKKIDLNYKSFYGELVIIKMLLKELSVFVNYGPIIIENSTIESSKVNIKEAPYGRIISNEMNYIDYIGDYNEELRILNNKIDNININVYKGTFAFDGNEFKALKCNYSLGRLFVKLDGKKGYTFNLNAPKMHFDFEGFVQKIGDKLIYGDGEKDVEIKNVLNVTYIYKKD